MVELTLAFSKLPPALERAIGAQAEIRRRALRPARTQRRSVRRVSTVREADLLAAEAQYRQGATLTEIAERLGIDRRRLAARLRARGVGIRRRSPTEAEVVEMIRRYESGESLAQVGDRLGFDAETVRNHLIACGIARGMHTKGTSRVSTDSLNVHTHIPPKSIFR